MTSLRLLTSLPRNLIQYIYQPFHLLLMVISFIPSSFKSLTFFRDTSSHYFLLTISLFYSTNTYEIDVPTTAENSHTYALSIQGIYFDIARPYPKVIHQDEMQCIRFEANLYLDSAYSSDVDEVYVIARSQNYLATSPEITFQYDAETFLCRNKNIEPHTKKSFFVHYSSPAYFLGLTQNEREVIISHIAPSRVQERVNVRNTGPKFEGELNGFKNLVSHFSTFCYFLHFFLLVPLGST